MDLSEPGLSRLRGIETAPAVGRRVASQAAGASSRAGSKIDTQQPIQDVAPIGARRAVSGRPGVAADDELFLERLRSGEDAAFEQLVRLHAGRLHRIARSLVGNEEDARDCVQQAFLSAFRSIGRFEGRSSLSTWLHRIVTNAALVMLRRDRRNREVPIDSYAPDYDRLGFRVGPTSMTPHSAEELLQREEIRKAVRDAIDSLPERHRTILVIRDIAEFTAAETAEILGVPPSTVKSRVHRARKALRELLWPVLRDRGGAESGS